jgi:hypothetical protein
VAPEQSAVNSAGSFALLILAQAVGQSREFASGNHGAEAASVRDSEIIKLASPIFPDYLQITYVCAGRSAPAELNYLLHFRVLALKDSLHATVRKIPHPTLELVPFREILRLSSEEDALNSTIHKNMRSRIQNQSLPKADAERSESNIL